jgi:hypothetical protein
MPKFLLLLSLSFLALSAASTSTPPSHALRQTSFSVLNLMDGFAHGAQNSTTNLCLNSFDYIRNAWGNFKISFDNLKDLSNVTPAISYLRFWADAVRDNVTNCKYAILVRLWIGVLDPANLAEYVIKYFTDQSFYNQLGQDITSNFDNGNWYGFGYNIGEAFQRLTNFAY